MDSLGSKIHNRMSVYSLRTQSRAIHDIHDIGMLQSYLDVAGSGVGLGAAANSFVRIAIKTQHHYYINKRVVMIAKGYLGFW